VVVVVGAQLNLAEGPVAIMGAVLIVTIRVLALWRRWNAPVARGIGT
jgi:uncharacterized membrane protein YeiH